MVWGAIAYNTRSRLVLIRGTMTVQWYVHDILQPHVLPLMQQLPGAIFQQVNARPHTAKVSQDCFRTFTTLPWPARSPDLSPIEHIWDHLGRQSTCRVAGQVDRSECAVRNCWEQWTREGAHARKTGSGATRKTARREDRRIVRQALVDPTVTRSTIRADVGVAIVPQTISRHLAEANLQSKRPFRALPLTPEYRQLRLQWCQTRSMWNVTDWQKVVFSDESR
ncbi:transposable element Tc1 transposase [Trichonephila clavipes]|nr:transposable element Tc1 transposase [Trichonephila clavipes]